VGREEIKRALCERETCSMLVATVSDRGIVTLLVASFKSAPERRFWDNVRNEYFIGSQLLGRD